MLQRLTAWLAPARFRALGFAAADLPLEGWTVVEQLTTAIGWRGADGTILSLSLGRRNRAVTSGSDAAVQRFCLRAAAAHEARLIDITRLDGVNGPSVVFIYKRRQSDGHVYFGWAHTGAARGTWLWFMIARELGQPVRSSDDRQLDQHFPDHPLSRMRSGLLRLLDVRLPPVS